MNKEDKEGWESGLKRMRNKTLETKERECLFSKSRLESEIEDINELLGMIKEEKLKRF